MDIKDDGSLNFLNIQEENGNKHFNCKEVTQQKLINISFWIIDILENVKTKFGEGRTLVKIKINLNDSDDLKFFTNSSEIKYVLKKVKEMNKFPRKATMRACGTRYYLE